MTREPKRQCPWCGATQDSNDRMLQTCIACGEAFSTWLVQHGRRYGEKGKRGDATGSAMLPVSVRWKDGKAVEV